jgi:hypothetical protein
LDEVHVTHRSRLAAVVMMTAGGGSVVSARKIDAVCIMTAVKSTSAS